MDPGNANQDFNHVRQLTLDLITEFKDGDILDLQNHLYHADNTVEQLQAMIDTLVQIRNGTAQPTDFWVENLPAAANPNQPQDIAPPAPVVEVESP